MKKTALVKLTIWFLIVTEVCWAEFTPAEQFTVYWGQAADQLRISSPLINDPGTPEDSTDDDIEPGQGPTLGVVDDFGNVIFASYSFTQLKAFDSSGVLLFDFSGGQTQIEQTISGRTYQQIFPYSNGTLLVGTFPGLYFVPVVDYAGNVVDSLFPFGSSHTSEIIELCSSPDGKFFFLEREKGMVSLVNGQYFSGGSCGYLAANGSFYAAWPLSPDSINFNKYENPDSLEVAASRRFTPVAFPQDSIYSASILGGGDGHNLIVYIRKYEAEFRAYEVWELDLDYNLVEKITPPPVDNTFDVTITPFVTRQIEVYEFRCLNDGVHVIKWTKQ